MKRVLSILAITVASSTLALADGPNAKVKELKPLEGHWSCQGTAFAFMGFPEHKTAAKFDATWQLDGYWLEASFQETKTPANATPVGVRYYWGWDDAAKAFASVGVDNSGAHFAHSSPGWSGDAITFGGELKIADKMLKFHDVYTKVSATKVMHRGEAEIDGKWTKLDEETCTK